MIVWITGLSGAGKTALGKETVRLLRDSGTTTILLDGDELREILTAGTGPQNHSRAERIALARRYGLLCLMLARQDLTVVIATICLFEEVMAWNRANLPGYFEVYLDVPIEELRRRDPKGIYRQFDRGEVFNVAGLDLPIDEPSHPDWKPVYDREASVHGLAVELLRRLEARAAHTVTHE